MHPDRLFSMFLDGEEDKMYEYIEYLSLKR
jgi:hypothetical protein